MKRMELSSTVEPLTSYAAGLGNEILVVTKGRRPIAAVVPLAEIGWEWVALSQHPDFRSLLAALPDSPSGRRKRPPKRRKR
ncbi:MAG: hypothetical protein FJZ38_14890 [Candidatus Rokubacteria bacterium]|nr:hypothetical protein [Candidatus Rokubacteria bacterium]